jgi:hypothetical protein
MIGTRVHRKILGIMGYRKDSKQSRVRNEDKPRTMGNGSGITGHSDGLMECVYTCILAVLVTVMVLITVMVLVTSTAVVLLQRSILDKTLAALIHHHHRKTRRESANSGEARHRESYGSQCTIWKYARRICSTWHSAGFDQMIHGRHISSAPPRPPRPRDFGQDRNGSP